MIMPDTFQFEIITPEQVFYSATVSSLIAPGTEGSFGVLAHHAPLLARSSGGKLKIRETTNQERVFEVGPGIVEVLPARLQGNSGASEKMDRVVFFTKQARSAAVETK